MLEYKVKNIVDLGDWDTLVQEEYGKPYSFQQQDGCKSRGSESFQVPAEYTYDFKKDEIPYEINGDVMGVSFKSWLATEPEKYEDIFWERNFYPSMEVLAQDLYEKGMIKAGEYTIEIDW